MNKEAQEKLNAILAASPEGATPADIEFLQSRISYLTADQIATFFPNDESSETSEAPKKRAKKVKDEEVES